MLPQLTLLLIIAYHEGLCNVVAESESARTLPAIKYLDATMSDCCDGGRFKVAVPTVLIWLEGMDNYTYLFSILYAFVNYI